MAVDPQSSTLPKTETITFQAVDGKDFKINKAIAMESMIIKNFFGDDEDTTTTKDSVMPLQNFTPNVLSKVIDYLERLHSHKARSLNKEDEEVKLFFADLVNEEAKTKIKLIDAANYLDTKDLLEAICQAVVDTIKDMSVEQVREFFQIKNDFTPDEEAKIRKEIDWDFE